MEEPDDSKVYAARCSTSTPTRDELDDLAASKACHGEPAPPGTDEIEEFPLLKSVNTCPHALIGLEFVLEKKLIDWKKSKYMCLLCSSDEYDLNSVFQHLTSQKHYLNYLEQYFPELFSALDSLKANQVNKNGFETLVSHLIGKLEEKYGLLRPTIIRGSIIMIDSLKEIILSNHHFKETAEDKTLKKMLVKEYTENTDLLQKDFPLVPKNRFKELSKDGLETFDSKKEIKETVKSSGSQDAICPAKLNDLDNLDVVPMDVTISPLPNSSPNRPNCEENNKATKLLDVEDIDSTCSDSVESNTSVKVKKTSTFSRNSEKPKTSSIKKFSDVSSSELNSTKCLKIIPKTSSRPISTNEIRSSRKSSSKRSSRRERSTSNSRFRNLSRSRSPIEFRIKSKSCEKRNYRRPSPGSASSASSRRSRCRSRSRSPLGLRRRSLSSSHSSSSSPHVQRGSSMKSVISCSTEKRYRNNSFEYCEAVREVKFGPYSKPYRTSRSERSHSPSPKSRKTLKSRSRSNSPVKRLRRMLAHETLSKNAGCVVRVDTAKSISSRNDDGSSGPRKIERVTSEVTFELKSSINSDNETDKNNVYDLKIRRIRKRLRQERRKFKKCPESYSNFEEEWKLFWCNRFNEIQAAGLEDPHNYNYRPDWTRYWIIRVKQIFKEKYQKLKSELKESLGIPDEKKSKNVTNSEEVVEISDGRDSKSACDDENKKESAEMMVFSRKEKLVNENENDCKSKDENSPADASSTVTLQQLNLLQQTLSACLSSTRSPNSTQSTESVSSSKNSKPTNSSSVKSDDSVDVDLRNDLNVISVLRQLTVLESQLGSSATLITNLLANGLVREKKQTGSSVRLLTVENRLFLDVVKEKLKGQLILDVVPERMVKPTRRCIKSIDELMKATPEPNQLDPRVNKVLEQNFISKSSTTPSISFPATTHAHHHTKSNNIPSTTYSTPQILPTDFVYSTPAPNPSTYANSVPLSSTSAPPNAQSQNFTRADAYPPTLLYGPLPSTAYVNNPVSSPAQGHSVSGANVPVPSATYYPSVPNRPVVTQAVSVQSTIAPTSTGSSSYSSPAGFTPSTLAHKNRPKPAKRPSIYDEIPWSEQLVASTLAQDVSLFRPSPSSTTTVSTTNPRVVSSLCHSQIPHVSPSPRQMSSSTSSSGYARITPVPSTLSNSRTPSVSLSSGNLPAPLATPSSSSSRVPTAALSSATPQRLVPNLPHNNSGMSSTVKLPIGSLRSPVNLASSNVASIANSLACDITLPATMLSTGGREIPTSLSAGSISSSAVNQPPVIDLTDDCAETEISNAAVDNPVEKKLIKLLTNFLRLPRSSQEQVVEFMRQLEDTNPDLVEKLKKYYPSRK